MKVIPTLRNIAVFVMLSLTTPALANPTTTLTVAPIVATQAVVADEPPVAVVTVAPVDVKPTMNVEISQDQLDCLVKVMNHEAGGETAKGQKAVAYVVINRMKSGRFPTSVCGVVYQRAQFTNIRHAKPIPESKYSQLKTLALNVLSSYSYVTDPTIGSLWYHNHTVWPSWRNMVHSVDIGHHIFYKAR